MRHRRSQESVRAAYSTRDAGRHDPDAFTPGYSGRGARFEANRLVRPFSNCNTAALVATDGSIDWLCLPRFDGPVVFAALLDPDGGHWSIAPAGTFRNERRYENGSLVLSTTFSTGTGVVRVRDALLFRDGQRSHDIGHDAPHELARSVEGSPDT